MDGLDPDVIRGIERVTGETFDAETGQWTRVIDGAVAELHQDADGITAEIRIPARQPERM